MYTATVFEKRARQSMLENISRKSKYSETLLRKF
jgi:hypothetical protein